MRRPWTLVLLVLVANLPGVADADAGDHVAISEILPDPAGGREFIELHNAGSASVDLAGWSIVDAAGNRFTMPAWNLTAGAFVVVWGGGEPDPLGPAWSRASVWNNDGDTATLYDATGAAVSTASYGGAEPLPGPGQSLSFGSDGATVGQPSPGYASAATGGQARLEIPELPPVANLTGPTAAVAGQAVRLLIDVQDPNGNLASWALQVAGALVLHSTESGTHTYNWTAVPGTARFELTAQDEAGSETVATHSITVLATALEVALPADGIRFVSIEPGAATARADASFTIRNLGDQDLEPIFDMSDFRGPAGAVIPVDGRLQIEIEEGGAHRVVDYQGPLTPLGTLMAGAEAAVTLVLLDVPSPLPAGPYGTSFTVA